MAIKNSFKNIISGDHSSDYGVFVVCGLSVGLALVLFLLASTINEVKEYWFIGKSPTYQSSISVNGKGEVIAVANIASFNFSISEKGKDVGSAQNVANEKNNNIVAYLKSQGIEAKDIKTSGYSAYPNYTYNPDTGRQTLEGYEVSINVTVKVRNIEKAGEVLSTVGGMGISNVSGLNFIIDDKDSLKREARDMAIADAKEEAQRLADKLGVSLGAVTGYYEMDNSYYGYGGEMNEAKATMAPIAVDLETGEDKITSNVSVTFEIIN